MEVVVKKKFDQELKEIWQNFEEQNKHIIFQSYLWNKNIFEYLHKDLQKLELTILIVKKKDDILAIFPFVVKKFFFFNIVSWLGDEFSDYLGPIIKNNIIQTKELNEIYEAFYKTLKTNDIIYLKNIIDDENIIFNPYLKISNVKKTSNVYGIKIQTSWNNYLLSNNLTKTQERINYYIRKLNNISNFSFFIAHNNEEKKKIIIDTIKNKKKLSNSQSKKNLEDFFLQSENLNNLHCSCLRLDNGKIISSNIGILQNNKFIYFYPSYVDDKNFSKYSIGKVLLYYLIKYSFEKKIDYFDFGIGNEEYKKKWSNYNVSTYEYLYPISITGYLYKTAKVVKNIFQN